MTLPRSTKEFLARVLVWEYPGRTCGELLAFAHTYNARKFDMILPQPDLTDAQLQMALNLQVCRNALRKDDKGRYYKN